MTAASPLDSLTPDQIKTFQIFYPYAFERTVGAVATKQRFVHYTSADTALKMFRNRQVWMRKSSCMNDFRELDHGLDCLNGAMKSHGADLRRIFDRIFPGFFDRVLKHFNGWLPHFREDTFITCLSEHDTKEDGLGRLSMWRAYGGSAGVAVVLNNAPFLTPSDALKAYSSPVAYLGPDEFEQQFGRFVSNMEANVDLIKGLGEEAVLGLVSEAFRSAMLCTKHPGFHEEREWRIIYSPRYRASPYITTEIESVAGTPQPVSKILLRDLPAEGLTGIEVKSLVDRVIIGPTKYPWVIQEAFITLLTEDGMEDAAQRVIVSDIPLRN